jgi:putative transposase
MIEPDSFFHIYNQGNNKQRIFYEDSNYIFFLRKVRRLVKPHCYILGYCLMPNHFHFLVYTNRDSISQKKVGSIKMAILIDGFRILESSYTQAINKRLQRSGSLFRQRTKYKHIGNDLNATNCLNYIHQNPMRAGLVSKMEHWRYSSFRDYCDLRDGTMADKDFARSILRIKKEDFYENSYKHISDTAR